MITIHKARFFKDIEASPLVTSIHWEDNDGRDVWIDLVKGLICGSTGTHTIHEWRKRDAVDAFNTIKVCDCDDCVK